MPFKRHNTTFIVSLLLIIINFSNISQQVNGDATLINNVCQKTPYPKDCLDCLHDNSGAVQMTVRELAGSVMYCTYNLSRQLQKTFVGLAAVEGVDQQVKKSFELCGSTLEKFTTKMAGAQTWWWDRNDDEAKKDFNGAKGDYVSCQRSLDGLIMINYSNQVLPSQVGAQFKGLNYLYLDTFNVILQSEEIARNV
ncbi:hypothetical protein RND81_09G051800 [Saponaria officinalis]|uniref:Pectinesterase inhibitor domain-containing protein n=1 Tax=Saponaria officinalis TaxID=3572 RepID=A0AAW1IJ08_SAPOF